MANAKGQRLTTQQKKFVEHYVETLDSTLAAREAGYSCPGPAGWKLLRTPIVKQSLTARLKPRIEAANIKAEEILWQLQAALNRNLLDFIDEETGQINLDALGEWTPEMGAVIDGIKQTVKYDHNGDPIYENEIKFVPKMAAIKTCMELLGMVGGIGIGSDKTRTVEEQARQAELDEDPVEKKIKNLTHQPVS
jgi:hypothetical protein